MPIPKPHKNEKEDEFISRCMGDEVMVKEYPDEKQRAAICHTQWEDKDKKEMEVEKSEKDKEIIRKIKVGRQYRILPIERRQIDEERRTVDLSFSSEEPVERFWGIEILDHQTKSVNLRRLKKGGALLIDHDMKKLVGVIEEVKIDESDRKGRARVRFGRSDTAKEIFNDVLDGIRSNVSVGYQIDEVVLEKEEKDKPSIYRVTRWEPYEISLVSVPADISVGVGRSEEDSKEITIRIPATTEQKEEIIEFPKEEKKMSTKCEKCHANLVDGKCPTCEAQRQIEEQAGDPRKWSAVEYERRRIEGIKTLAKINEIDDVTRDEWIKRGYSLDEVANDLLKIKEERSKNTPKTKIGMTELETQRFSLIKAIRASYEQKWDYAPFEAECSRAVAQSLGKVADPKRFYVPFEVLERPIEMRARRDISVAEGGGSMLVATENLGFIELLRNRSVVFRMGATRLTGLVGNVAIPKQTAAATAYWLASESTTITESQQTFVQVALSPHSAGAYTEISRQLLLQSSPAVEGIVSNDLATVVALAVDSGVLKGTGGAGQPLGITATSGIGSVTISSFDYAKSLEFLSDVAAANVQPLRGGYVTDATGAVLMMKTMKATNTFSPVWEGNLWDGRVNGFPAMSSQQITALTLLFGDWSAVVVGEWGILEIEVNPYANFAAGIIGIRAIYTMDCALRYAAAFSYGTGMT